MYLLHSVGFRIVAQCLLLRFFYTTASTFYDDYSIYILVFSSLFLAVCLVGMKTCWGLFYGGTEQNGMMG